MIMIHGKHYYFFRLDTVPNDPDPEYRIGESLEDLQLRFGDMYMRHFHSITQLNEVTIDHIIAIHHFLLQQL